MQQRGEQLEIEVVPAPNAIGRWDVAHEISAYRKTMGDEALERQRVAAEAAKDCTCGEQEKANALAVTEERKPRKLHGHQHKPGCKSYNRPAPKLAPKISQEEQETRYHAEQLRQAIDRSRAAESNDERST